MHLLSPLLFGTREVVIAIIFNDSNAVRGKLEKLLKDRDVLLKCILPTVILCLDI